MSAFYGVELPSGKVVLEAVAGPQCILVLGSREDTLEHYDEDEITWIVPGELPETQAGTPSLGDFKIGDKVTPNDNYPLHFYEGKVGEITTIEDSGEDYPIEVRFEDDNYTDGFDYEIFSEDQLDKVESADGYESLREELEVAYKLIDERNSLLSAIPACEDHGAECVPHAIEWVIMAEEKLDRYEKCISEIESTLEEWAITI